MSGANAKIWNDYEMKCIDFYMSTHVSSLNSLDDTSVNMWYYGKAYCLERMAKKFIKEYDEEPSS